jgi:hypothetical protein
MEVAKQFFWQQNCKWMDSLPEDTYTVSALSVASFKENIG